jgi:hypothetical protein
LSDICCIQVYLLDCNFSSSYGFAGEEADFAAFEADYAVTGGVDSEVTAHSCTIAGALGGANLADYNLAGLDLLAAKQLNAYGCFWRYRRLLRVTYYFLVITRSSRATIWSSL